MENKAKPINLTRWNDFTFSWHLKGKYHVFFYPDILKYSYKLDKQKKTHLKSCLSSRVMGLWSFSPAHWWRHWGQKAILPYKSLYNWQSLRLVIIRNNQDVIMKISISIHFSSRNPKMAVILCQNLNFISLWRHL